MATKKYNIEKTQLEKFTNSAGRLYHIVVVLDCFCENQQEIEELRNIAPLLKYLKRESDNLYCDLFDLINHNIK